MSFTLADLRRGTKLSILTPHPSTLGSDMVSISRADCKLVADVLQYLQQAGIPLPKSILTHPTKRAGDIIKCGVALAFENDEFWQKLPKQFTVIAGGRHRLTFNTQELHRDLKATMLPYAENG